MLDQITAGELAAAVSVAVGLGAGIGRLTSPWRRVTDAVDRLTRVVIAPDEGGRSLVQRVENLESALSELPEMRSQVHELAGQHRDALEGVRSSLDRLTASLEQERTNGGR